MAFGSLGALVVSLEANIAKFSSDLGRAVAMAESSMNKISKAVTATTDVFKTLGAGFGVYQLAAFGSEVLHAAAELENLHLQTGLSVTSLSAMSNEAARSGENIQEVALAVNRLEKSAGGAVSSNGRMRDQFAAIGLSAKQLADDLQNPDKLLLDVAKALEKFSDDGNKSILTMALMGKGGAQYLEFLHNIAVDGYAAATATEEQAKQAKAFEEQMTSMSTRLKAGMLNLTTGLVPLMDVVTTTWQMRFSSMWTVMKGDFDIYILEIKKGVQAFNNWSIGAFAGYRRLMNMPAETKDTTDYTKKIQAIKDAAKVQIDANKSVAQDEQDHYAGLDYIKVNVQKSRPSLPVVDTEKTKLSHINDGLVKAMDERIKVIDTAIKNEQAAEKNLNMGLDDAFKHSTISLAAYSTDKHRILEDSYRTTQKLYDDEVDVAKSYIARIEAELKKETGRKVDKSQETQQASVIAAKAAEREQALSKLAGIEQSRAMSTTQHAAEEMKTNEEMIRASDAKAQSINEVEIAYALMTGQLVLADQLQNGATNNAKVAMLTTNGLADSLEKLNAVNARKEQLAHIAQEAPVNNMNIAYQNLIGNTEAATRMQIALDDEMIRNELTVRNATGALAQLAALEKERELRASRSPLAGMTRSIQDYQKGLLDVAKATENMTSKMLTGMEDALTSFVMTGKLNFKSLIESMLADMIRMQVRTQAMPWISKLFGLALNAAGSYFGGGGAAAAYATTDPGSSTYVGPPQAAGGPVNQGQQYTVGERGPEQFVPSVQGAIVPNGGSSGAMQLSYAPTIQIDSRSDRAQVQSDTANLIRQGHKELIALLQRYNPGLRS